MGSLAVISARVEVSHEALAQLQLGGAGFAARWRPGLVGAVRLAQSRQNELSVAPGRVADLVLIDGDPTTLITDVRRVRTVVRGDRWFDAQALYDAVGIARDTARYVPTAR